MQLMGLKNLTFNRLRWLLGTYESVSMETFYETLKDLPIASSKSRGNKRGECFQCGETGYFAKDCKNINECLMLALNYNACGLIFDEDMWMIYTTTTNHMTPYEKYFTSLDRTHKARIKFMSGDTIMSKGIGDVMFMTNEGMKTIENVLFVPGIERNVLSVPQMTKRGYAISNGRDKCTIKDRTRRLFAQTMRDERGFSLRSQET